MLRVGGESVDQLKPNSFYPFYEYLLNMQRDSHTQTQKPITQDICGKTKMGKTIMTKVS